MADRDPADPAPTGLRRPVPVWATALALTGLLVALAAVVSPFHCCGSRLRANESAAIATLKNIATAQAQLRDLGAIDVDGDGACEYGFLAELAAAVPLRAATPTGSGVRLDRPLLSSGFRKVEHGVVKRSGYWFRCFLRGRDGRWLGEADTGGAGLAIDPDAAEHDWRVLAWPTVPGSSGTRTFAVDATGAVRATAKDRPVFGGEHAPSAEALDDPTIGWRDVQ